MMAGPKVIPPTIVVLPPSVSVAGGSTYVKSPQKIVDAGIEVVSAAPMIDVVPLMTLEKDSDVS